MPAGLTFMASNEPQSEPPVADAGGPYYVEEGDSVNLNPSIYDNLNYAWDFDGDGEYDDATGPQPSFSAANLDGPLSVTVGLLVTDTDGTSATSSATINVLNLPPLLSNVAVSSPINEGDVAHLMGNISDPGVVDTFTLSIDWGDGSPLETFDYPADATDFSRSHQYLDDGPSPGNDTPQDTYVVTVTVTDDDGGSVSSNSPTFDATVLKEGLSWGGVGDYVRGVNLGGSLYFPGYDQEHGTELWKTDGTAAGTVLVKDIWLGPDTSQPMQLVVTGDKLFFTAADADHGAELWTSDGTEAGTNVIDLVPGVEGSNPFQLTEYNGELFFTAQSSAGGPFGLWKSDGSLAGTMIVKDNLNWVPSDRLPGGVIFGGMLYFPADDGVHGVELWKTDGTQAGTVPVKDIWLGQDSSQPTQLTVAGGRLFFTAADAEHGTELWTSDGTETGTHVIDLLPGIDSSSPIGLTDFNGTLMFGAQTSASGDSGLWRSDGTPEGTSLVKENIRVASADVIRPVVVGDTFYFSGGDAIHGDELWKSDGTAAGTSLVKDIYPGPSSATLFQLTNLNGRLFFRALDPIHGLNLWTSDGTESGTQMVELWPGMSWSMAFQLTPFDNDLIFMGLTSFPGEFEMGIWKVKPHTEPLTVTVANVTPVLNSFSSSSPAYGGANPGELVSVEGTFTDVGILDTHAATIDWGDGSPLSSGTITESGGAGSVSASHAYASGGTYTITLHLQDDDGGTVVKAAQAVIAGTGVNNGVLSIVGTENDDHVTVNLADGAYIVHSNFFPDGVPFMTFSASGVSQIIAILGGGDDQIQIAGNIATPTLLDGGQGNDILNGGGGKNILIGGDGNDKLIGGGSPDVLIGGDGGDDLVGNSGDDLLVAGRTDYDANYAALSAIMAEWSRTDLPSGSYENRRDHLRGVLAGGLNGTILLIAGTSGTIHDDGSLDKLNGGAERDLYFANLMGGVIDKVIGLGNTESVFDL